MILVFNKTDVKDASFAKDWMTDYDTFQAALNEAEQTDTIGGFESAQGGTGGSGYMGSLLNSMSLVLEEFYAHLSVVAVSSKVGTGMDEFFAAVQEKADEFERDYQPELDRRRNEREDEKRKRREKEVEKMMKGMNVAEQPMPAAGDKMDEDPEEDELDDDEIPDEENDREGLQARYEAALAADSESVGKDASFAKYLYTQNR